MKNGLLIKIHMSNTLVFEFLGLATYKGFAAIYPPSDGVIRCGCTSCKRDVSLSRGFVENNKYLCASCTTTAIGSNRAFDLLLYAQEKCRQVTGKYQV